MTISSAFLVHKNGINQPGCSHCLYTFVNWHSAPVNVGGHFNLTTGMWSPPPGLVEISAMIWWGGWSNFAPVSLTQPNSACIKVWKNGQETELQAAPGYTAAGYPNTAGAVLPPFVDICEEGDEYGLWAYGTSKNALNDLMIEGHHSHTWMSGKAFGCVP